MLELALLVGSHVDDMRLDDMNSKEVTNRRRSASQRIKVRPVVGEFAENDSTTFTIVTVSG